MPASFSVALAPPYPTLVRRRSSSNPSLLAALDRRDRHAEQISTWISGATAAGLVRSPRGDLRDGVAAPPVRAGLVVHLAWSFTCRAPSFGFCPAGARGARLEAGSG